MRSRVLEHVEVRLVDVVEAGGVESIEDVLAHCLVRNAEQRADEGLGWLRR